MASSVFFRFKSQKEPSRVTFDGTGISIFELKREIITISRLGDGTDFELVLSSNDSDEVYEDDTTIIPRSTTVVAKRLPAAKSGRGGAARYVSGKIPMNAKNTHRSENISSKPSSSGRMAVTSNNTMNVLELHTEEERMAAVLKMGADQWEQQQQEMANATRVPVSHGGTNKGKPMNVPDHPPPPGYVCYRCGEKGHWIQVCPTNDDPTFDGRPRIKRTTGIPRSFLKIVEKPTTLTNDGTTDDTKQPSGVMVNADGDWVIAEPDKASWEQFQAKAKQSAAAQEKSNLGSKELQERGLECSIDKRLFVDPTKTPCCQTTYCNECITNALLDNDLQCPGCGKEGVLIDDLVSDVEMVAKIRSHEEEKSGTAKALETQNMKDKSLIVKREGSSESMVDERKQRSPSSREEPSVTGKSPLSTSSSTEHTKKRPAEANLESIRTPAAPSRQISSIVASSSTAPTTTTHERPQFPPDLAFLNQPPFSSPNTMPGMNAMNFSSMNPFMGMPMNMQPIIGMNSNMLNPMMLPNMLPIGGMQNQWTDATGGLLQMQGNGMYAGGSIQAGMMPNSQGQNSNGHIGGPGRGFGGRSGTNFNNQQRTTFGQNRQGAEESAYFRQPVNPHRHQSRRNNPRPADYREI